MAKFRVLIPIVLLGLPIASCSPLAGQVESDLQFGQPYETEYTRYEFSRTSVTVSRRVDSNYALIKTPTAHALIGIYKVAETPYLDEDERPYVGFWRVSFFGEDWEWLVNQPGFHQLRTNFTERLYMTDEALSRIDVARSGEWVAILKEAPIMIRKSSVGINAADCIPDSLCDTMGFGGDSKDLVYEVQNEGLNLRNVETDKIFKLVQ